MADSTPDTSSITLEQLTKRHPDRVRWEPKWSDYRLLYLGGDDMLRAAGQLVNTRISTTLQSQVTNALTPQAFSGQKNRRFLYQLEAEPDAVYFQLWNRAYYINYLSAILDYFRHWLFSEDPIIRPATDEDDPEAEPDYPDWWNDFYESANGSGQSFPDFVRDVFLDVLICRRAGWLIGRTDDVGAKDDDGNVILTRYPAEQIIDWEKDSTGELEWIVLATRIMYREFPGERQLIQRYTYLDRDSWQTWEVKRGDMFKAAGNKENPKSSDGFYEDDELQTVGSGDHGLDVVPFVMLEIPNGLWIADKLAAPCVDIFNKQNRLANAQLLACVVQAYLKSTDPTKRSLTIGEGYLVNLKTKDTEGGGDEDFGWKSPDVGPLEFIAKQLSDQRDEVYRIVHQMSLAVDSKAVGAIARSGASKIEDRKASEIILAAYGGYVTEAMTRTLTLLSKIFGDGTEWELDGYNKFDTSSLDEEIQIAALAQTLNLKSKTAREELELKTVGRLLDFVSEATKDKIDQETRDAYEMEEEAKLAPPDIPQVVGLDGKPTPNVGAPIGGGGSGLGAASATSPGTKAFGNVKPPMKLGDNKEK